MALARLVRGVGESNGVERLECAVLLEGERRREPTRGGVGGGKRWRRAQPRGKAQAEAAGVADDAGGDAEQHPPQPFRLGRRGSWPGGSLPNSRSESSASWLSASAVQCKQNRFASRSESGSRRSETPSLWSLIRSSTWARSRWWRSTASASPSRSVRMKL